MIKQFVLLIVVAFIFSLNNAMAAEKNVTITFTYNGPAPTQYQVECNGTIVHSFAPGNFSEEFKMNITENELSFVIIAVTNDGVYRSNPYMKILHSNGLLPPEGFQLVKTRIYIKYVNIKIPS